MPKGQKPVNAGQLYRVLADLRIETRARNGGGTVVIIADQETTIPPASKPKVEVRDDTIRRIANLIAGELVCDRKEVMDAFLDRKTVTAGKPTTQPSDGPTKADTLELVAELHHQADALHTYITAGQRSPSLYRRVHDAARQGLQAIAGWPPVVTGVESPDDTAYRPTYHDPVTAGVARATGLTAAAAVRGKTLTRWQYDERTDV
jgi:hypothetical protein